MKDIDAETGVRNPGNEGLEDLHKVPFTPPPISPEAPNVEITPPVVSIDKAIISVIQHVCFLAHDNAVKKGFHEDHELVTHLLSNYNGLDQERHAQMMNWVASTALQAELARVNSEVGEWVEAARKNPDAKDDHLPDFKAGEAEAADILIRVFDTCQKRGYRLGEALVAKLAYNANRPHRHGKNS